jgi:hypothetical protein
VLTRSCAPVAPTAASPLWKKVKGSGAAPHLARWFDFMAALPECAAAAEELDPRAAAAKAKAGDAAGGVSKGGGGEHAAVGGRRAIAGARVPIPRECSWNLAQHAQEAA